ncbi:MAG TPA: hypothetical protein VGM13_02855, partial [Thermoanaerobaculia bacterium]
MSARIFLGVSALLAVLAAPAILEAAGTVTGISASPSPAAAGQNVVVVVQGSGDCQATVDFGDGPPGAKLVKLPATFSHVYSAPKEYVLRVYSYRDGSQAPGLSPCGGTADTSLTVKSASTKGRLVAGVHNVEGLTQETDVVEHRDGAAKTIHSRPAVLPSINRVTPGVAFVLTGAAVTFTVEATGDCNRSRIDFGDGSPVVEYPIVAGKSQPAPTHAYAKGGT